MQFHKQLIHHHGNDGPQGDCYRTCIACILDLAPADVPHPFERYDVETEAGVKLLGDWLQSNGFQRICVPCQGDLAGCLAMAEQHNPGVPFVLTGAGPRGVNHCVVACGGEIIHDPAPEGGGLIGGAEPDGYLWIEYILRRL